MTDVRPVGGPNWYKRNKGWISPSLDVLTAVGTIISAIALILAAYQIAGAERTLRAGTQYQISKDHDELLASIPQRVWDGLQSDGTRTLDPESERHVLRILSFASSVLEQKEVDLVTSEFWDSFRRNLCGFLRLPSVAALWRQKIETRQLEFSDELVAFKGQCKP
jgi:hypothetical protein